MRLFIAEKPQIASDIVKALGGSFTRKEGYYESSVDVVTWCIGHIIKSAEPEIYDPAYGGKWNTSVLPLKLYPVKYSPCEGKEKQVKTVTDLIRKADLIVHAGDPDDEGQLLVDEVLIYAGNTRPVKRLLINDNTPAAVKKALGQLADNNQFKGLFHKALARSVGDDIFGKSMTRAYTVTAQQKGYQGVLSVGRVQTPVLGLICKRWLDNKNHTQSVYQTLQGDFSHAQGNFTANWKVNDAAPQDEKKRLNDEHYAEALTRRLTGQPFDVVSAAVDDKRTSPPLPFNLLKLQQTMSRTRKFSANKTLQITQSLRESHKAITYNRSDCQYLSDDQYSEAPQILEQLKSLPDYQAWPVNPGLKSKAFNTANITAHTAIIPTGNVPDLSNLSEDEKAVYLAITERYMLQFLPEKRYQEASVVLKNGDETFSARAVNVTDKGFTAFTQETDEDEEEQNEDSGQFPTLARLQTGEQILCEKASYRNNKTTPPPLFTESTLLAALTRVADFVTDPHIKSLLKLKDKGKKGENGGIGTPATRDKFVPLLVKRGLIAVEKQKLVPTQAGLDFYHSLPAVITQPDMTALWSEKQQEIEHGELSVDDFVESLYQDIQRLLGDDIAQTLQVSAKSDEVTLSAPCPACGKGIVEKPKLFVCQAQCGFKIWKNFRGKDFTKTQAERLLKKGETDIKGLKAKSGKPYDGICMLDKKTGEVSFKFNEAKGGKR